MNLVIDAGNTQIKLGVFGRNGLLYSEVLEEHGFTDGIKAVFQKYPGISHGIVASVGHLGKSATDALSVFCKVHAVGPETRMPFRNNYATTHTLGADRMALATAAFYGYPRRNALVVDAGSCVTFDFLNGYGEYLGGAISPGLRMRYRALHEFTARLPRLEPEEPLDLIGNATASSMHSGVVNGLVSELDGIIGQYRNRYPDLTVILTGGDAQFLAKRLKSSIFAHSNFLLEGLNQLLDYNKS